MSFTSLILAIDQFGQCELHFTNFSYFGDTLRRKNPAEQIIVRYQLYRCNTMPWTAVSKLYVAIGFDGAFLKTFPCGKGGRYAMTIILVICLSEGDAGSIEVDCYFLFAR